MEVNGKAQANSSLTFPFEELFIDSTVTIFYSKNISHLLNKLGKS
jgi:hypothetical protein